MGRREENVLVFQDTTAFINESDKLMKATAKSISAQQLFLECDEIPDSVMKKKQKAKVVVSGKRTLEAASAYNGKKVCILNFASATNPGGGVVHGSSAQEESICRCSTLYFNLATDEMDKAFYEPHCKKGDPLYNDDVIYSPDVYVIKSDTSHPVRLREHDWYQVNVITCAAPNLREKPSNSMNPNAGDKPAKVSEEELKTLLERRIRRIFAVAAHERNDVLILGAFGCGAFRNPPKLVASVFHKVMDDYREYFDTIEYAIFHTEKETENYKAFAYEFREEIKSTAQKGFDLFNNNMLGALKGMSNDIIEEALEAFMKHPCNATAMAIHETIRVRMHCRAQFVVPTPTQPDGSTGFGMIRDDNSHTDFFVAYTGIDKMDPMAGPHSISMGMKKLMEAVLASHSDGIYLNPKSKGDVMRTFGMTGYQLFRGDILKVLRAYYNPAYRMESVKGDITHMEVDAIVNAANRTLLGGGGVDGAIHDAAGNELLEECKRLGGCETGEAKITKAYRLHAKSIIHTVGPVYSGSDKDKELLANCYRNSLELAKANRLYSIAFPGISTGVYGYPVKEASRIAYNTVLEWLRQNELVPMHVIFVSFNDEAKDLYDSLTDDYKDFIIKT